ncbi:uncharacterized protein LOC119036106 isoform X2 [Artibeus jamaicensis]|nr:uncharacterized protein LOC119036106 isoform X2 [Artibeus jamaicensis]
MLGAPLSLSACQWLCMGLTMMQKTLRLPSHREMSCKPIVHLARFHQWLPAPGGLSDKKPLLQNIKPKFLSSFKQPKGQVSLEGTEARGRPPGSRQRRVWAKRPAARLWGPGAFGSLLKAHTTPRGDGSSHLCLITISGRVFTTSQCQLVHIGKNPLREMLWTWPQHWRQMQLSTPGSHGETRSPLCDPREPGPTGSWGGRWEGAVRPLCCCGFVLGKCGVGLWSLGWGSPAAGRGQGWEGEWPHPSAQLIPGGVLSLSLAGGPIPSQPCLWAHQADQNGPSSFVIPPLLPSQHLKDTRDPGAPRKGGAQT